MKMKTAKNKQSGRKVKGVIGDMAGIGGNRTPVAAEPVSCSAI